MMVERKNKATKCKCKGKKCSKKCQKGGAKKKQITLRQIMKKLPKDLQNIVKEQKKQMDKGELINLEKEYWDMIEERETGDPEDEEDSEYFNGGGAKKKKSLNKKRGKK